jgi:hypothetical protein
MNNRDKLQLLPTDLISSQWQGERSILVSAQKYRQIKDLGTEFLWNFQKKLKCFPSYLSKRRCWDKVMVNGEDKIEQKIHNEESEVKNLVKERERADIEY